MVDPTMFLNELTNTASALPLNTSVHESKRPSEAFVLLQWLVFIVMSVGTVVFAALSWNVPPPKRLYHYLATTITAISALSYFSLASYTTEVLRHSAIHDPQGPIEIVYGYILLRASWIRYVDWSLTFSLTLVILGLVSGVEFTSLFASIVAALVLTLAGFHGEAWYIEKIGWIIFAVLAHLIIAYQLLIIARATARKRGPAIARFYTAIAAYTVVVWFGYILVWFVFGREGPVGPAYFGFHTGAYAILDVLSKSVFGAWLLFAYAKVPDLAEKLGEGWVDGAADEGRIRIEDGEEEG